MDSGETKLRVLLGVEEESTDSVTVSSVGRSSPGSNPNCSTEAGGCEAI